MNDSQHGMNRRRMLNVLAGGAAVGAAGIATTGFASPARIGDSATAITADSVDPTYNQPYIDVNEVRHDPVSHRYVHGGFTGTDARFSFYFPKKGRYAGRFFHNTYPLATTSDIAPFPIPFDVATGNLGFTIDSGAYYVQTNLGGADRGGDPAIGAYRVNAAAAKYSRVVAAELYGDHRPYGYLFGGSGGSYQVMGSAQNTSGVWDGFLPYVLGTPNAAPSVFTVRTHALRVLRRENRFPAIMDAISPGGSGDPHADLNDEELAALDEATLLGYPPRGWWNHATLNGGYLAYSGSAVRALDPTYVDEFWTEPGYLGSDPTSSVHDAIVRFDTTVAQVIDGPPRQLELTDVPTQDFADALLHVLSGAAAGRTFPLGMTDGKTIGFVLTEDPDVVGGIRVGDRVRIDNSWALALQTYQRHQVPPTSDQYGWNQFRDADGNPIHPQRDVLVGPISSTNTAGGSPLNGTIHGKTLVLQALMDIDAFPWQADWYRSKVREALGSRFEDDFALWFIDHAQHDNPATTAAHAHTVSYEGALQQGLRDLSAWVEKDVRPANTRYEVVDSQVRVPAGAHQRRGIQPVVELRADGGERADVAVGQPVTFTATITVPPRAGKVVAAEWDFDGLGDYPVAEKLDHPRATVRLSATRSYAEPGTYFAVLRATSQREGNVRTPYGRIQNIARVRVVVS